MKLQPDNSKPLAETALDRAADLRREPARQWTALSDKVVLYGAVSLGAVIGGVLRALASNGTLALLGPGFPWGTFLVNVLGSFVIGFFATLTGPDGRVFASTRQRQFVMTGICGGFTTFSMFTLETIRLAQEGKLAASALNIGISIIGWFGAVWLGHLLALRMNRLKGS